MKDAGADGPGYITDVEYTGEFHPNQAPAWLAYIAAINGYAAPRLDRAFAWCELGCGRGVTALVLAALHPQGQFHACDINHAHVGYGERLRADAGVGNLSLHLKSVGELQGEALPAFDFITLHGLYSWVPDPVRAEILAFARARLRSGGVLMLTYNALPGWAHVQPLRQMMQARAASLPGDSLERARAAFAYVKFLADEGAEYFRRVPAAAEHLREIARKDIRYIAHEYITPHGEPFYFAQVEARLRAAGFAFAGSMAPADNYPELMVPRRFAPALAGAGSRAALEAQRDFIVNTSFRADLYALQPAVQAPADVPLDAFDGLAFTLIGLPERLALSGGEGAVAFDLGAESDPVRAVHARLAGGPADARALHRAAGLDEEAATSLLLQKLVVAKHLAPCAAAHPAPGWLQVNSALVEAGIRDRLAQVPLACPLAGTASPSEVVHAAAIESAARHDDAESAARSVLGRLRALGHPVNRHDEGARARPASDAEVLAYVSAAWRALRDPSSPDARQLRLFGVLA